MRKIIKKISAGMVLTAICLLTGMHSEAASGLKEQYEISQQVVSYFGEGEGQVIQNQTADQQTAQEQPVYSGGMVSGLQQTNATTTSVTISWNAAYGAIGYVVGGYY